MVRSATVVFRAWIESAVAPIAHSHGFKGKGPSFRKRVGEAGPNELGEAIVLLARLDPGARTKDAVGALELMEERYPAWTRRLRALATLAHAQRAIHD